MTTRVTAPDFEALVRANPDAVVEVDVAHRRYFLKTASRVTVWTPMGEDDAAMVRAHEAAVEAGAA